MNMRGEEGAVSVMGILGIAFILAFFVFSLEMGIYCTKYKRLRQSVETVNTEVRSMLPYYVYSDNYKRHFEDVVTDALGQQEVSKGDIFYNVIIRSSIRNETTVTVYVNITTKYKCKMAGLIGVHELPLRLESLQSYSFETRGRPEIWDEVEVWGEEDEESDIGG